MSVAEAIFEWFADILLGWGKEKPNMNYLAEKVNSISIEAVPCNPVARKYVDGGELRQYEFVFAFRDEYDEDKEKNIDTAEFFEELSELMEEKSDAGELPELDKYEAREMKCVSHGYAISNTQRTARYQMQCRFLYYKKG